MTLLEGTWCPLHCTVGLEEIVLMDSCPPQRKVQIVIEKIIVRVEDDL